MFRNSKVAMRPAEHGDLEFLRDLANELAVRENVVGWDWPLSLASQESWFASGGLESSTTRRFIVETLDGTPIGLTGLWDVDWHSRNALTALKLGVIPEIRGQGLGVAAIHLLMDFAFNDVGLHRLYGAILVNNPASIAAYVRKSGWKEEGISRQHVWRGGRFMDLMQVGILKEDYDRISKVP